MEIDAGTVQGLDGASADSTSPVSAPADAGRQVWPTGVDAFGRPENVSHDCWMAMLYMAKANVIQ
jgi:hypothetical protein